MAAYETTATLKACAHTTGLTASKGSPRASGSSVRFVSIGAATATVDELRDDALMLAWARDQHGHARIAGSMARNLVHREGA